MTSRPRHHGSVAPYGHRQHHPSARVVPPHCGAAWSRRTSSIRTNPTRTEAATFACSNCPVVDNSPALSVDSHDRLVRDRGVEPVPHGDTADPTHPCKHDGPAAPKAHPLPDGPDGIVVDLRWSAPYHAQRTSASVREEPAHGPYPVVAHPPQRTRCLTHSLVGNSPPLEPTKPRRVTRFPKPIRSTHGRGKVRRRPAARMRTPLGSASLQGERLGVGPLAQTGGQCRALP